MSLMAPRRLAGWRSRSVLVAAVVAGGVGALAAPALAAPKWEITMTHANPFGAQASSCPGGKPEPEATPPCGIDPLTEARGDEGEGGEGKTFARESSGNS